LPGSHTEMEGILGIGDEWPRCLRSGQARTSGERARQGGRCQCGTQTQGQLRQKQRQAAYHAHLHPEAAEVSEREGAQHHDAAPKGWLLSEGAGPAQEREHERGEGRRAPPLMSKKTAEALGGSIAPMPLQTRVH
jgi:hypothetical protein